MATKKTRVKRRKTKRRQRGGAAPSKEGEKFKLTVDKTEIWDTLEDVTYPAKKSKTLTPEVAKSSKDDIVEFTGEEYSPNYVMKTNNGKFIKAKETELEKAPAAAAAASTEQPAAAPAPTAAAPAPAAAASTEQQSKKSAAPAAAAAAAPAPPSSSSSALSATDAAAQSAALAATKAQKERTEADGAFASKLAEIEQLKAQMKENWTCECTSKQAAAKGGKKRRKTKRKKRSRKRRSKKRR